MLTKGGDAVFDVGIKFGVLVERGDVQDCWEGLCLRVMPCSVIE